MTSGLWVVMMMIKSSVPIFMTLLVQDLPVALHVIIARTKPRIGSFVFMTMVGAPHKIAPLLRAVVAAREALKVKVVPVVVLTPA